MLGHLINCIRCPSYLKALFLRTIQRTTGGFRLYRFRYLGKEFVVEPAVFVALYNSIICNDEYYLPLAESEQFAVLDLGANYGLSVAYFLERYPRSKVIAYEADPAIYAKLRVNIGDNYPAERFELHNCAVGVSDERLAFISDGKGGGRLADASANANANACTDVNVVSINKVISVCNFRVLKMDIEGYEQYVLPKAGLSLASFEFLIFEFHTSNSGSNNIGEILTQISTMGFSIYIRNEDCVTNPWVIDISADQNRFSNRLVVYCRKLVGNSRIFSGK